MLRSLYACLKESPSIFYGITNELGLFDAIYFPELKNVDKKVLAECFASIEIAPVKDRLKLLLERIDAQYDTGISLTLLKRFSKMRMPERRVRFYPQEMFEFLAPVIEKARMYGQPFIRPSKKLPPPMIGTIKDIARKIRTRIENILDGLPFKYHNPSRAGSDLSTTPDIRQLEEDDGESFACQGSGTSLSALPRRQAGDEAGETNLPIQFAIDFEFNNQVKLLLPDKDWSLEKKRLKEKKPFRIPWT